MPSKEHSHEEDKTSSKNETQAEESLRTKQNVQGDPRKQSIERAISRPAYLSQEDVLRLQESIGNTGVQDMLKNDEQGVVLGNDATGLSQVNGGLVQQTTKNRFQKKNVVQRDHNEDLEEFANLAEQDQQAEAQRRPPPVSQVNNIADASGARNKMGEIEGYRDQMQQGGTTGTIDGAKISANETAIATLSDYLVTVGEQGRTLSTFQEQASQVRLDFGRVAGQMMHLESMGVVDPDQTSSFRAEQVVGAATGAGSATESAGGVQGDAVTMGAQVQEAHNTLMTKGNEFSRAQRDSNGAVHNLNSALSTLNSGIIPREEDPELATEQRAIKAKVSTMQSRLSTGLQVLSAIGGATGLPAAASQAATGALGEAVTGLGEQALGALDASTIATAISEEWYREETNSIESQIAAANARSREAAITANISGVRSAQTALFSALQTLEEKTTEYQQARDTLRTTMDNFGMAADREAGGEGYRIIAGLLGDVDVLTIQIDTTINLGETEEHAASQATEARGRVEGTRPEGGGAREGGLSFYRPYQTYQVGGPGRSGGVVYRALANQIYFVTAERMPGSSYGGQGAANPIVRQSMEELEELRTTAQGMRSVLSQSMGLTMER